MGDKIKNAFNRFLSKDGAEQIIKYISDLYDLIKGVETKIDRVGESNKESIHILKLQLQANEESLDELDILTKEQASKISALEDKDELEGVDIGLVGDNLTIETRTKLGITNRNSISLQELFVGEIVDSANICYLQEENGKVRAGDYNRTPDGSWKPLDRTNGEPHYIVLNEGETPDAGRGGNYNRYSLSTQDNKTVQYLIITFITKTGYKDLVIPLDEFFESILFNRMKPMEIDEVEKIFDEN